jgi:Cupredoxin-like domain
MARSLMTRSLKETLLMRRTIATFAVVLAATVTLAACGGGGATANTNQQAGAPASGGSAAGDAGGNAAAAGGGVPQITGAKVGDDDETTGEKLPQGASVAKAQAAGMGSDGAPIVTVTSSDTGCMPDKSQVAAGKVWFKLVNQSKKINELYLESAKGKEMIEVEKIRSGQSGAFAKTVQPGQYMLACAPGMGNTQIRTPLTVQ